MRKNKQALFFAIAGIFFGILAASFMVQLSVPVPLSSAFLKEYKKQADISALPNEIVIPKLNFTLDIKQTTIQNGKWGVSRDSASHLIISSVPGKKGNIIVYGHNRPGQLKILHKVVPGDYINLKTIEGKTYVYKVITKSIVWPDKIDLLYPTKSEVLTLYTCTGLADSKRLIVRAIPLLELFNRTSLK